MGKTGESQNLAYKFDKVVTDIQINSFIYLKDGKVTRVAAAIGGTRKPGKVQGYHLYNVKDIRVGKPNSNHQTLLTRKTKSHDGSEIDTVFFDAPFMRNEGESVFRVSKPIKNVSNINFMRSSKTVKLRGSKPITDEEMRKKWLTGAKPNESLDETMERYIKQKKIVLGSHQEQLENQGTGEEESLGLESMQTGNLKRKARTDENSKKKQTKEMEQDEIESLAYEILGQRHENSLMALEDPMLNKRMKEFTYDLVKYSKERNKQALKELQNTGQGLLEDIKRESGESPDNQEDIDEKAHITELLTRTLKFFAEQVVEISEAGEGAKVKKDMKEAIIGLVGQIPEISEKRKNSDKVLKIEDQKQDERAPDMEMDGASTEETLKNELEKGERDLREIVRLWERYQQLENDPSASAEEREKTEIELNTKLLLATGNTQQTQPPANKPNTLKEATTPSPKNTEPENTQLARRPNLMSRIIKGEVGVPSNTPPTSLRNPKGLQIKKEGRETTPRTFRVRTRQASQPVIKMEDEVPTPQPEIKQEGIDPLAWDTMATENTSSTSPQGTPSIFDSGNTRLSQEIVNRAIENFIRNNLQDSKQIKGLLTDKTEDPPVSNRNLAAGALDGQTGVTPNGQSVTVNPQQVFNPSVTKGLKPKEETDTSDRTPGAAAPNTASDKHTDQTHAIDVSNPVSGVVSANQEVKDEEELLSMLQTMDTEKKDSPSEPSASPEDVQQQDTREEAIRNANEQNAEAIQQESRDVVMSMVDVIAQQAETRAMKDDILNPSGAVGGVPMDVSDEDPERGPMDAEDDPVAPPPKKAYVKPVLVVRSFVQKIMATIPTIDLKNFSEKLVAQKWEAFRSSRVQAGEMDMSRQSTRAITSSVGTIQLETSRAAMMQPDTVRWDFIWDQIHNTDNNSILSVKYISYLIRVFAPNVTVARVNWLITGNPYGHIPAVEFEEKDVLQGEDGEDSMDIDRESRDILMLKRLFESVHEPSTPLPTSDFVADKSPIDNSNGPHTASMGGESSLDRKGFINNIPDPRISERGGINVPNVKIDTKLNPDFDPTLPEGPNNRKIIHSVSQDTFAGAHSVMRDLLQAEADRLLGNKPFRLYAPIHSQPTDRFLGAKNFRRLSVDPKEYIKSYSYIGVKPDDIETMYKWNKRAMLQYGEYMYSFSDMDNMKKVVPIYDPSNPDGVRQEFMELQEMMKEIRSYQLVAESRAERVHDSMATRKPIEQHLDDFFKKEQYKQEGKLFNSNAFVIATDDDNVPTDGEDDSPEEDDDADETTGIAHYPTPRVPSANKAGIDEKYTDYDLSTPKREVNFGVQGLKSVSHVEIHELDHGIQNSAYGIQGKNDKMKNSFVSFSTGNAKIPMFTQSNRQTTSNENKMSRIFRLVNNR